MACEAARNLAYKAAIKGSIAYNAGNYTAAVRHYTEAINHAPSETSHQNRYLSYYQLQQYSNALADAKKTVELNPGRYTGYICLGNAHTALKQYDEAVAAFKKGLEVDPNNVALKSAISNVEYMIKAKAEFDAARSMNDEKDRLTDDDDDDDQEDELNNGDDDFDSLFKQFITQQNTFQQRILELLLLDHNKVNNHQVVDDDDDIFSINAAFSVLNRMVDDGLIEEAGQLWFVATDLFEDAGKRELFISMPHDKGRLAWLQHKHKKQDPLIVVNKNNNNNNNVGGAQEKKEEPKKLEMRDEDMGFSLL